VYIAAEIFISGNYFQVNCSTVTSHDNKMSHSPSLGNLSASKSLF